MFILFYGSAPAPFITPDRTRTCTPGFGGQCSIQLNYGSIKRRGVSIYARRPRLAQRDYKYYIGISAGSSFGWFCLTLPDYKL